MPVGIVYSINGNSVQAPDEEVWGNIVMGTSLTGRQKRSPYRQLEWRKVITDACRLDWFDYDNTTLASLTTRPYNKLDEHATYTDVICQSVTMRQRRSVGNEMVAVFLVNTELTS